MPHPSKSGGTTATEPPHATTAASQMSLRVEQRRMDSRLLIGYDPAHSRAWPGAAPESIILGGSKDQLDLWATETLLDSLGEGEARFHAQGYTVRPLRGQGATTQLDAFCARHHYLGGGGMNGRAFALYAPDGEMVGVANFAPCSNRKAAHGMQVTLPEDEHLGEGLLRHLRVGEDEYLDCVRLCVAEATDDGVSLGTGAESFLYAACLRHFVQRNRELWRAWRMVELRLPLSPGSRALLEDQGLGFVKVVRTFADLGQNHAGTIYQAVGAWYMGLTRKETVWAGIRSGAQVTRRSISKLRGGGRGHLHQVLRAVWEGGDGAVEVRDLGGKLVFEGSLSWIRRTGSISLSRRILMRELKRDWSRWLRGLEVELGVSASHLDIQLRADESGYEKLITSPKHRYGTYLGRPAYSRALIRRCKYLREGVAQAEAAWFAKERRYPRGMGYNWPRAPALLGNPEYPKRPD